MQQVLPKINLPWNSHSNYWICLVTPDEESVGIYEKECLVNGLVGDFVTDNCYAIQAPRNWNESWNELQSAITRINYSNPRVAVIGSSIRPSIDDITSSLESIDRIDSIASNLWLGESILEGRVECHFQPIMAKEGSVFGYESFVRIKLDDGKYISGQKIIDAAREIGIQHLLDKYLHTLAIKSFAEAELEGTLFINFITGFIQLPAKYMEGLGEAAKMHGLSPSRIAMDVSQTHKVRDVKQLVSIINFCHERGYLVALDDITSLDLLADILEQTKPDIIKLDKAITQKCTLPKVAEELKILIEVIHSQGSKVLAEGIELEVAHKVMSSCDIDLLQGYYYAMPMPASEIKAAKKA
jgi:EAL domain-containing protein (putative c-di-GMP-specific phosphodiesterase class I)